MMSGKIDELGANQPEEESYSKSSGSCSLNSTGTMHGTNVDSSISIEANSLTKTRTQLDEQYQLWLKNNPDKRLPDNVVFGGPVGNGKATAADKQIRNGIRSEVGQVIPRFNDLNEGNIAFASVNIDGNSRLLRAFSGDEAIIPGFVATTSKQNQLLPSQVYKGHDRWSDTEQKILENVLRDTDANSSGNLRLFSERQVCGSCEEVIKRFAVARPNIQLELVVGRVGKNVVIDGKPVKNTFMNN